MHKDVAAQAAASNKPALACGCVRTWWIVTSRKWCGQQADALAGEGREEKNRGGEGGRDADVRATGRRRAEEEEEEGGR